MSSCPTRPLISVFNAQNTTEVMSSVVLPGVFTSSIRPDIVHFVEYNLAKNRMQAHAVNNRAGMQHSAESWGTGRAVARIPRVSGSGTHRAGQAAFGNFCRKGRMFNPLKIWRRWHRKVNLNQKRHAVASSLAASSLTSLVLARGHRVMDIPELPLVIENYEWIEKTKDLLAMLRNIGCGEDLDKVIKSKHLRAGKGKMRNRRYVMKRGPLMIFGEENEKLYKACRNVPGLDVCNVNRLNLRMLAPGGTVGRLIVWTKSAFESLDNLFGTFRYNAPEKKGYQLQRPMMLNTDLSRLINSDQIQSVVNDAKVNVASHNKQHKNPLTNKVFMNKLNPYAKITKRMEKLAHNKNVANKEKLAKSGKSQRSQLTADLKKKSKSIKKKSKIWSANLKKDMAEATARDNENTDDDYEVDED